jgi:hypothetical protein
MQIIANTKVLLAELERCFGDDSNVDLIQVQAFGSGVLAFFHTLPRNDQRGHVLARVAYFEAIQTEEGKTEALLKWTQNAGRV